MTLRLALGRFPLGSVALMCGLVDMTGHRQRLGASHTGGTGTSRSCRTLPALQAGSHMLGRCAQPRLLACPQSMD